MSAPSTPSSKAKPDAKSPGKPKEVTSGDVNEYLKEITGQEITAKDFRTWAGTVLAAMALNEVKTFDSAAQAKRNLRSAIRERGGALGHRRRNRAHAHQISTATLCLKSKSAVENELREELGGLKPEEAAVLAMLRGRLARELSTNRGRGDTNNRLSVNAA